MSVSPSHPHEEDPPAYVCHAMFFHRMTRKTQIQKRRRLIKVHILMTEEQKPKPPRRHCPNGSNRTPQSESTQNHVFSNMQLHLILFLCLYLKTDSVFRHRCIRFPPHFTQNTSREDGYENDAQMQMSTRPCTRAPTSRGGSSCQWTRRGHTVVCVPCHQFPTEDYKWWVSTRHGKNSVTVVCGVRRPSRLEEPEQGFGHTGHRGPQRGKGVRAHAPPQGACGNLLCANQHLGGESLIKVDNRRQRGLATWKITRRRSTWPAQVQHRDGVDE